jgi:hypothetical protein
MRLKKNSITIGILAVCGLAVPAAFASSIEYTVAVNTSSQATNYGYLEMQFNASSSPTQLADAVVTNVMTDGVLDPSDPNNDEDGDVSGLLPGTLSFDNGTTFNDYFEGIAFGDSITFDLLLSGPAINSPNGDGGGTFTLDFLNSSITGFLFTDDPINDLPVFTVNVNPDGSTTGATYPSTSDGTPVVTAFAEVPEPSMPFLVVGGLLAFGALRRRHRATL